MRVVVALIVPEVPVIVRVLVPIAAVVLAANVNPLVEVVGFCVHDAVTPFGNPVTERLTFPLKPYSPFT